MAAAAKEVGIDAALFAVLSELELFFFLIDSGVLGVVTYIFCFVDWFGLPAPFVISDHFCLAFILFNCCAFLPLTDAVSVPFPSAEEARFKAYGDVFLPNL